MLIMFNIHVGVCMMHCAPLHISTTTPNPIHPPANPQGGTPRISQNSITLELIKIIQFCLFEDLNFVENAPPMGGCIVWWMGVWFGGLMGGVRSNH